MPRWLLARPYLRASAQSWINLRRRHRVLLPGVVAAVLMVCGLLTLPVVGAAFDGVAQNPVVPFVLLAVASAVLTARRKARVYYEQSSSWLAPLAAPTSMAVRVTLPTVAQMVALLMVVGIAALVGSLSSAGAVTLAEVVSAAGPVGFVVGWLVLQDKSAGAPDFHYVAVRKPRAHWATAPRLTPLSFWAVAQAKVATKPKFTSRILIFILLGIPLGTSGTKALGIAGGAWVMWYLLALAGAAARVAFTAARWLSVTTVRYVPFTYTLGYRVVLMQLWTCVCVVFLVASASVTVAWQVGWKSADCVALTCVDVVVACWLAMRAAGMEVGVGGASGGPRVGGTPAREPGAGDL